MWQGGVRWSLDKRLDLFDSVMEIKRDISLKIILVVGLGYLVGHIALTVFETSVDLWSIWSISLVVFPVCVLSVYFLKSHFHLAQFLWHVGLFAAITLAYLNFRESRILYLYCIIPFSLVLNENWQFGLAAEIGLILVVSLFSGVRTWPGFLVGESQAILLITGATLGVIGWALTDSMFLVVDWYLASFERARETIEENRQQRIQLAMVIKNLDQAYYRLQRTNADMVAAWKAAAEAERLKTEFATNISHELRTPLNLIVGFSEMMMVSPENYGDNPLPGSYRRDLNTIYRSARHLLDLVDDVIDLARLDAGRLTISPEVVDLAGLIQESAAMVRSYIEAKGLNFQVDIDPGCPLLRLDRLRIRQVLFAGKCDPFHRTGCDQPGYDCEKMRGCRESERYW
jgi:signal transduction histidine kinase